MATTAVSYSTLHQSTNSPSNTDISFVSPQEWFTAVTSKLQKWNYNWDMEADDEGGKRHQLSDHHILLIRHGQYNVKHEDSECTLTKLGQAQAHSTALRLKKEWRVNRLVQSTMTRAQETAGIIALELPRETPRIQNGLLAEGFPCVPEPNVLKKRPAARTIQSHTRIEAAFREFICRASPQCRRLGSAADGDTSFVSVVVCHANVIRYFVCRALQLPPEAWLRFSLPHGSVTWITVKPDGRVVLRCLGDATHMPNNMLTYS